MKRLIILLGLLILICPGCASIICGDEDTINISSKPVGAQFEVINSYGNVICMGFTPANVTLKRGSDYFTAGDYKVKFSMDGYRSHIMPIPQGFETGWYFAGNIVFGGFMGWLFVDPLTGAMWDIKDVNIILPPIYGYKPKAGI